MRYALESCVRDVMCVKVCPINYPVKQQKSSIAHAAHNKISLEHRLSSSGGAAHLFSKYIIEQRVVVYG